MGKSKETNTQSFDKSEMLNNIRKRNLKVVLYRNKYLLNNDQDRKSKLIKELLYKERKHLNLHQEESYNLCSEDEEEISNEKILKLLEEKKSYVFTSHSESDSVQPSPKVLRARKKCKQQRNQEKVIFPIIPKNKIDDLFSLLTSKETVRVFDKNQRLSHTYVLDRSFWNSPSCVLKAIKDSIFQRKWDNLPRLLLMLIHLTTGRYKSLVRHICQILAKLHPGIQESGLQDQFKMIHQVYKKSAKMAGL